MDTKNKMNKRRIIVGSIFFILFLPLTLAGLAYSFISRYFVAGVELGGILYEAIGEKIRG